MHSRARQASQIFQRGGLAWLCWHSRHDEQSPPCLSRCREALEGEGGPDYTDQVHLTDCLSGAGLSARYWNWCRSITAWTWLSMSMAGRHPCAGVVTIKSQNKEITRSGQYWVLTHHSRVFRRGARRSTPSARPLTSNTWPLKIQTASSYRSWPTRYLQGRSNCGSRIWRLRFP